MDDDELATRRKKSRCEAFRDWIGSPSFYIYANYILGAWGDWMWQFAVGLYLVKLSDGLLRLAAIYGFCGGGCVLLFGGLVGDWVDRNPRLRVMVTTLFLQNLSLMLSASAVCFTLFYADWVDSTLNGGMRYICEAVIVVMAISAQMSSVGYKIAIEKDWIVVIAAGNKAILANLNAVTRAIDLSCKILAPTTVGFIMTYGSDELAALVIALWNLLSVFVEFALLRKVYTLVPALAVKGEGIEELDTNENETVLDKKASGVTQDEDNEESLELYDRQASSHPLNEEHHATKTKEKKTCLHIMFDPFITLVKGWRTYAKQRVVYAGLSLAFLYMTVLGFDSITTGYIYANGVKEYLVAISMGLGGFTGILGAGFFTISRKKLGLERTGMIAYSAEILCLCFCVASIFTPGSPFQPFYNHQEALIRCQNETSRATNVSFVVKRDISSLGANIHTPVKSDFTFDNALRRFTDNSGEAFVGISAAGHGNLPSVYPSQMLRSVDEVSYGYILSPIHVIHKRQTDNNTETTSYPAESNSMENGTNGREPAVDTKDCRTYKEMESYISIILFLVGIVTSRVGLWMADLVVTQLLQENVIEKERGVVNGVQNSLNMLMDMLKFTLVILIPHIPHFGYLILASFSFICAAGGFFAYHTYTVRKAEKEARNNAAEHEAKKVMV